MLDLLVVLVTAEADQTLAETGTFKGQVLPRLDLSNMTATGPKVAKRLVGAGEDKAHKLADLLTGALLRIRVLAVEGPKVAALKLVEDPL